MLKVSQRRRNILYNEEKGNPVCHFIGYSSLLAAKIYILYAPSHSQASAYHGTGKSSMGHH